MFPIYEQGKGVGIGHGVETFLKSFQNILDNHILSERARSFAFVFYDFEDQEFRKILKHQGVFAKLDRLSGKNMSIFYMHESSRRNTIERFNKQFKNLLGVPEDYSTPFVVFFKTDNLMLTDVSFADLSNFDSITQFHGLYEFIRTYIDNENNIQEIGKNYQWLDKVGFFLTLETIKAFIAKIINGL